jgi:hypothetical protein
MKYIRLLGAVLALSSISSAAYAETDPRDYAAIAPAKNNSLVTLGYARAVSTTDTQNLTQTLGILRALYVLKFDKLAVIPVDVFMPMADVTVYEKSMVPVLRAGGITEHVSGIADLTYLPTVAYVIPEGEGTSSTVAASAYVTFPTGMYDETKLVNIGKDRWSFQPQIAFAQRISTLFTAEAVGYGIFYTENSKLLIPPMPMMTALPLQKGKQDPTWGADIHVAYSPTVTGWVGLSYYVAANGRSFFGPAPGTEITTTPEQTTHSLRFTYGWRVEKDSLILFQFNQDIIATGPGATIGRFIGARVSHTWEL